MQTISAEKTLEALMPKREESDYFNANGLLVCGVCHTEKEQIAYRPECREIERFRRLEGNPDYVIFPKNCLCKLEEMRTRMIDGQLQERENIERQRRKGMLDAQYRECNFSMDDAHDQETSDFCRNYVDDWETATRENHGIMLYGNVGVGKTFYAACIGNALVDKGHSVYMTTIADLELAMSENFRANKREILNDVRGSGLLILDDVGKEDTSPAILKAAYEVINARYKAKKPLIITTNLTLRIMDDEIKMRTKKPNVELARIFDRLREMCVPVLVKSPPRREELGTEKTKQAYQLYGKPRQTT